MPSILVERSYHSGSSGGREDFSVCDFNNGDFNSIDDAIAAAQDLQDRDPLLRSRAMIPNSSQSRFESAAVAPRGS